MHRCATCAVRIIAGVLGMLAVGACGSRPSAVTIDRQQIAKTATSSPASATAATDPYDQGLASRLRYSNQLDLTTYDRMDMLNADIVLLKSVCADEVNRRRALVDQPEIRAAMDREQAAWEAWADADAAVHADRYFGGTLSGVVGGVRLRENYYQRILTLRRFIVESNEP